MTLNFLVFSSFCLIHSPKSANKSSDFFTVEFDLSWFRYFLISEEKYESSLIIISLSCEFRLGIMICILWIIRDTAEYLLSNLSHALVVVLLHTVIIDFTLSILFSHLSFIIVSIWLVASLAQLYFSLDWRFDWEKLASIVSLPIVGLIHIFAQSCWIVLGQTIQSASDRHFVWTAFA